MPVKQAEVISRLKAGETMIHVIEREAGAHKPYQYLSGGGQSSQGHLCQADQSRGPNGLPSQYRPVPRCRASGMGVGR